MKIKTKLKMKEWSLILFLTFPLLAACNEDQQGQENLALLTGLSSELFANLDLFVVSTNPTQNQSDVSAEQNIEIIFSKTIHPGRCTSAFTLNSENDGEIIAGGNALKYLPNSSLGTGSHVVELTTDCEDLSGADLLTPLTYSFNVGASTTPIVQAIGLESQGCSTTHPGAGSASGGDHTLGSCWWDSSLAVLSPTNYEFRGGDDGTGAAASTNACADVNTDNFRLIFSEYMDIATTTNAISLTRLSGPATLIKLASHTWTDCQTNAPFGCRVITLSFAEAEATCNDTTTFGNNSTNGDFNLSQTNAPQIVGFPLYRIEVAITARSTAGTTLNETFAFDMEGN